MTDRADAVPGVAGGIAPSQGFTPAYRNYALFVLMIAYTANYVDRQILAILLEPIKQDLGLNDTQLGFLSGITFAIFYATLGVPIAMWADRTNRRNIVALALTIFSSMTVLCGFVTNFVQLALARIGVGIGEAGSSPPSHSMISDMFPPEKRASAMGIYSLGINIGILIGFLVGGWVSQWYGWRAAFFIVGAPGLLIALLVRFTLKEPERGHADGISAQASAAAPKVGEVWKLLWSQKSFRHIAFGCALAAFGGYAGVTWIPAFLIRSFEMSPGEIGTWLALIIGFVGGAGTYATSWLADRYGKGDVRWNLWVVAIVMAVCFPFAVGMYLSADKYWALAFFLVPAFAGAAYIGPSLAMTQALVTLRMRAVASAVLFLILNLIGMGLGPQAVGLISDLYNPAYGSESLRYALLTVMVVWPWAGIHFVLGAKTLKDDLARAKAHSLK
ncbi:MAG: MFS transporter [Parvibaculum sp.]|jgi:predicted MFS family arabinose efflux permease|uniref:spinster family MFS transporter n=1 Tax=Parvibaculum sp. TaxID=2024848 RepID=UPI000C366797|nr:MFS transporter [Parvibaculum sp.]MAU61477.1 MFS transporter [Parvibaculum sp.]|tara:strand:+ start:1375 stop:2709 length:1335 start_codon:yes stop_codon:yes gene_type:complete